MTKEVIARTIIRVWVALCMGFVVWACATLPVLLAVGIIAFVFMGLLLAVAWKSGDGGEVDHDGES